VSAQPPGPERKRRLSARALSALVAVLTLLAPGAAGAQTGRNGDGGSMVLVYQTPWVGPSGDFNLRLRVERPAGPSNLELDATVYPSLTSRSEFAVTLRDQITAPPLFPTQMYPLGNLVPDGAGDVTLPLRFSDRLGLGRDDGVFPLRVDLRERGTGRLLDRFTTHVVYLPTPHTGPKLGVSFVLPLHAPPGLPADGSRQLHGVDGLVGLPTALDALRDTPVSLAPTPETLATLAASPEERAANLLQGLQQRVPAVTVLSGTYVPASLPALVAAGLQRDAETQVDRGAATISDVLDVRPDSRTWLARDPVDESSLNRLAARGVDRVVLPETGLRPLTGQKLTLTEPFLLRAGPRQMQAVVADTGLSAHFDNTVDPVLAANHLLADLAVVYLDRPGADRRAMVAVAPRGWRADRRFVDTTVAGLNQHPILDTISLDGIFSAVQPARGDDGRSLVRTLAPSPSGGLAEVAPDLRAARRRLDALASVLGPTASAHTALEERLLLAESSELRTTRARQSYVDAVLRGVDSQVRAIRMPTGRSITLTARKGEIPVTFQNLTGVPAKVVVKVESDKLFFPRGNIHALDLARRNTTERFSVELRTSGAFPLGIRLESPDGNLVIDETRLTVRSTAASRVSLGVSLGAALFLVIWWGRHALRGRRARRLVPA
jgi:uncharacterized protein DUF6049